MAKKKLSVDQWKANELSEKEQSKIQGGFINLANMDKLKSVGRGFTIGTLSIIDDTIDVRFQEDDRSNGGA